jgi:hypothetical protein
MANSMSKGGPKLFENFPDFTRSDTWIWVYAALYGLGSFVLRKLIKNGFLHFLQKFRKPDPAEQYKLLEELHRAMMLEKDKRIAELEKEVASLLKSGGQ